MEVYSRSFIAIELKSDHYEYKNKVVVERSCSLCNTIGEENIFHLVMQCEHNVDMRRRMFADIMDLTGIVICEVFKHDPLEMFCVILGKSPS